PVRAGLTLKEWLAGLPRVLAATDLLDAARLIAAARRAGRPVILGMGAHPIKVGLGPLICDLMGRGVITAVALNGAGVIHDVEMALSGHTSEDVDQALADGSFGMSQDTARFINEAIAAAPENGLGRAVGQALLASGAEGLQTSSLLATAADLDLTLSVHVALGTDIVHIHPSCDAAATGQASHVDFRLLAAEVADLEGGVYLNLGSAVILPEVFLKALTLVRNLGHRVYDFTTINLDMISHYRPLTNVVRRPTMVAGRGFNLIGHHEINFPLLMAAVLEEMA
ncbi:MAG: hypothetical protein KKC37_02945, partial [Proteobacteria bacterium]|nr:hypothetical protein [Pseudomonadota bacterium]